MHALLVHVSRVHALVSLHTAANSAALFGSVAHPVRASQKDRRQISFDGGQGMGEYTQVPPEHVSSVQTLLSSHNAAISDAFFGSVPQPMVGEHTGFMQMSDDVHDELLFV